MSDPITRLLMQRFLQRFDAMRNDRGAVYPPEFTQFQGWDGLTSWFHGQRFGRGSTAARLIFDEDHEIQSLGGVHIQAFGGAADTTQPSIAMPVDDASDVLNMIRQGCYLRVSDHSGFPCLLLRDGGDPDWHGNTQAHPGGYQKEIKIGKEGVWCPPCQHPMIMPPTERYINGYQTVEATYPIGGYVAAADTGYLRWEAWLEASLAPFASDQGARCWSGAFTTQLLCNQANKNLYTPLFALIESPGIGAQNVDLCGSGAIRGPANLTNTTFRLQSHAYDRDTLLASAIIANAIDDQGDDANIAKEFMTAYCFNFRWLIETDDPEGQIPALTHFQVTL